ncbi:MAG TPA: dynamin family protein [Candidatus Limnocylindria bacterium]|nr:dynamin family protein [Candidatus Limnocylindria bacterium]
MTPPIAAPPTLQQRLDDLVARAATVTADTDLAVDIAMVRDRLRRPLRVAIAGRAKAGKSTLLNALVGERLAATDATECTRIVTWYRHDLGYSVTAALRSGERRSLEFSRADGSVEIQLGVHAIADVERLEVGWPSSRLEALTLIDTPGLDSSARESSQRTVDALIGDEADGGEADAVVYLMRHLHRNDADFLEAFNPGRLAMASPVNAVALLSRADEIGAGRPDALESASAIAARYAADPRVRSQALTVLPIAGLLAETGATLTEFEVSWLRQVVALAASEVDGLLLSVDRFRGGAANPLPEEARERLLDRFGLFGLRFALDRLRAQPAQTAPDLARALVEASGIRAVDAQIRRHFADRSDVLKARSALARLRSIVAAAGASRLPGAAELAVEVERIGASSSELLELRLLHDVHAGRLTVSDEELVELNRLLASGPAAGRLGQPEDTPAAELRSVAVLSIDRWRTRASNPLLDRPTAEAGERVARTYESLYLQLDAENR